MIVNLDFLKHFMNNMYTDEGIKEWQGGGGERREDTKLKEQVRVHVNIISMIWHLYGVSSFDKLWILKLCWNSGIQQREGIVT